MLDIHNLVVEINITFVQILDISLILKCFKLKCAISGIYLEISLIWIKDVSNCFQRVHNSIYPQLELKIHRIEFRKFLIRIWDILNSNHRRNAISKIRVFFLQFKFNVTRFHVIDLFIILIMEDAVYQPGEGKLTPCDKMPDLIVISCWFETSQIRIRSICNWIRISAISNPN